MKQHIDALFDYISNNHTINSELIGELHGILYEIGSQWNYYKVYFEGDEQ